MIFACAFSFANFSKNDSDAYTSSTVPASIGSLTLSDYATRTDGYVIDGDILDSFFTKVLNNSNVSINSSQSLYDQLYSKVNSSRSLVVGRSTGGVTDTTIAVQGGDALSTQVKSMDFSAISGGTTSSTGNKTAPNPITIEFGGYTWNVVYLTTNTTVGNNDLVATLWMSEPVKQNGADLSVKWGEYSSKSTNVAYPSSMYSTSRIRVDTLNGGGDNGANYATSVSARSGTVSNREQNQFAQFTLSSAKIGNKSLTDFLVAPRDLIYQQKENHVWAYIGGTTFCFSPNEAWGSYVLNSDGTTYTYIGPDEQINNITSSNTIGAGGWYGGNGMTAFGDTASLYIASSVPGKSGYYTDWADDYLWLPSITETGYFDHYVSSSNHDYTRSLWGIPDSDDIVKSSGRVWVRSGNDGTAEYARVLLANGNFDDAVPTAQNMIRPALHLNLTQLAATSQKTARSLTKPEISDKTYNNATQTLDLTTLTNFDANKMQVTKIERIGGTPTGYTAPEVVAATAPATPTQIKFTEAGKYEVTLETKQTTDLANQPLNWIFNEPAPLGGNTTVPGKNTTTIEFEVKKAKLQLPSFGAGAANTKTYDGTTQTFTATNYPSTTVPDPNDSSKSLYPRNPLSVAITKTNGAMVSGLAPVATPTTSGTLEVQARNAGDYKATFTIADKVNFEWTDGSQATKDALFYMKPKELTVSDNGASSWSWMANDSTETRTITVSGLFNGDSTFTADAVDLQLKITDTSNNSSSLLTGTNKGDGSYEFVIDKEISIFGGTYSIGTFYVAPVLGGGSGGTHDANYSLSTALSVLNSGNGYKMVISPAGAGLSSYDLVYATDDGDSNVALTDGKVEFKYKAGTTTAATFTFTLESTQLASANLQVDTTYNTDGFVNGYKSNSASIVGTFTGYVRLHSTDPNSLFNGTDTDASVAFGYEITKADFKFDTVKWQYTSTTSSTAKDYPAVWNDTTGAWEYDDGNGAAAGNTDPGLPWYGYDYTLRLTGLPTGITVNATGGYTGNVNKAIGSYFANCNITYDTANFNAPSTALLRLNWSIVKGKVEIISGSWRTSAQGDSSNIFYVPTLQNVSGIDYEYYDLGTDANPIALPGTKLSGISDIVSVVGTEHHYYVRAGVKSGKALDGVTDWSDAIEIVDNTGGDVHGKTGAALGLNTKYFYTGDSRTPVQVSLNGAPYTYDKQPHGVLDDGTNNGDLEILVGSNQFPTSNFTVNYYERDEANAADHNKGTQLSGAPTDAGWYVIEIQLSATAESAFYATDEYFEFEIKPFVLDMSGVKWGYPDADGNEIAYNPSLPLQYALDSDGNAVMHTLFLIGMPKGDANGDAAAQLLAQMFADSGLDPDAANAIIRYRDNKSDQVTNSGSMTAVCEIDTAALSKNFVLGSLPYVPDANGIATTTQSWTIEPKKINAPKSDATHDFNGQTQDILSYAGLNPAELGIYYKLTGLTKRDAQNNAQTMFTSATCADPNNPTLDEVKAILAGIKDAGRYGITVEIIDKANVKFVENGVVGTLPTYSAQITINKLKVQVVGWQGDGNAPWLPSYASDNYPPNIVENKYFDMSGKPVTAAELVNRYNEQFRQTIGAIEGNEDNVEVEFLTGVDSEKLFFMLDQSNPPDPITKPTSSTPPNGTFTGSNQSYLPSDLETLVDSGRMKLYAVDEDGTEREVDKSYFTQTNAGKYKVVAKVNGNYYWAGTTYDQTPIEYEFEIKKAEIKGEWTTPENGIPTLSVPEEFKDLIEYEYRDQKGNVVPANQLKKGSSYAVSAKVKESAAGNVELLAQDENGNWEAADFLGNDFKVPGSEGMLGGLLPEDFPLWQVIVSAVSLILFIIFMILTAKNRKEKKEADEEAKKYQEQMETAADAEE